MMVFLQKISGYNQMRRQLGFVTQDTQLFSGTIRENMQFVKPDATDEEIICCT